MAYLADAGSGSIADEATIRIEKFDLLAGDGVLDQLAVNKAEGVTGAGRVVRIDTAAGKSIGGVEDTMDDNLIGTG